MHLDIASSLVSIGALTTLMGLWMLSASFVRGETNAVELRIWAVSSLVFGVTYALFASRGDIPLFWSLVVGNMLFAAGFTGFGWAIARVLEKPFPFVLVAVGILLCTGALFVTEVLNDNSSWRVLILAAITIVPWTVSFVQCTGEWKRNPSPHILALSLAWLAIILSSFARVFYAAYHGSFGYQGLPTGQGYVIGSYVLMMSPVLLTVGFFLLCAEQTQEVIKKLADTDPLTGVLNRRSVFLLAENRLASAKRHLQAFSCVTVDLDRFKQVNDLHGHAAGDLVLRHVTETIARLARSEDVFGRLGGDEFVLFLPFSDLAGAAGLAERFREAIAQEPPRYTGRELAITASFGVSSLQESDDSPLDLLNRADRALYEAKDLGGNAVKTANSGGAR